MSHANKFTIYGLRLQLFMLKIGYTPNIIVSLMMQIERDLLRNSSGIVSDVVVIRRPAQS